MVWHEVTPQECRLRNWTLCCANYGWCGIHARTSNCRTERNRHWKDADNAEKFKDAFESTKSDQEFAKVGNVPWIPFCRPGTEKVIVQEQLSKKILIDYDRKGPVCASVTSSTTNAKSKLTLDLKTGKLYRVTIPCWLDGFPGHCFQRPFEWNLIERQRQSSYWTGSELQNYSVPVLRKQQRPWVFIPSNRPWNGCGRKVRILVEFQMVALVVLQVIVSGGLLALQVPGQIKISDAQSGLTMPVNFGFGPATSCSSVEFAAKGSLFRVDGPSF